MSSTRQELAARRAVLAARPDYDVRSYARGWRASMEENETVTPPLDLADRRGEPTEWYDGYHDYACGNDRWHCALTGECD